MSKRRHLLISDSQTEEIKRLAYCAHLPLCEWVSRVLSEVRRPGQEPQKKLEAVRRALGYGFPTANIEQMLAEMERETSRASGSYRS